MIDFYIIYSIDIPKLENLSIEKHLKYNIPNYILNNPDKFIVTENDDESEEYSYCDLITVHRKYTAILNENDFLNFIDEFSYSSTCDTMGALTVEYGLLSAFCVEINERESIESLYVSLLFDEKLEENKMMEIEDEIREAIESGNINKEIFKI